MGASNQGADATDSRWLVIPRTLVFVRHDGAVLLMKRSSDRRIFPNQYNGLGGHIERDETPQQCAIREVYEEAGISIDDARLRAIHHIDANAQTGIMLFVFTASAATRDFVQTASSLQEGRIEWVELNALHRYDLVEDLRTILPLLFGNGEYDKAMYNRVMQAHVSYDEYDVMQLRTM